MRTVVIINRKRWIDLYVALIVVDNSERQLITASGVFEPFEITHSVSDIP